MNPIEVINTVEFWFGLTTGIAIHKLAARAIKAKFSALIPTSSDSIDK